MKGDEIMKYHVDFKVDGRYSTEVEANTVNEAQEKAIEKFWDMDPGEIEDVDAIVSQIIDENNSYYYIGIRRYE